MEYNKRQFNKSNEKKILRKVKKQWIVLSIATFSILGGFELVNSSQMISEKSMITVHADSSEESNGSNDFLAGNATQGINGKDNAEYQKGVKESIEGYRNGLGVSDNQFISTKSQNDPNYQYNPNNNGITVDQQSNSYQNGQQQGGWNKQSYIDKYNSDMKNSDPSVDNQKSSGVSGSYNNRFYTNTYQQYPYSYGGNVNYVMSFNQASKTFNDAETNAQNDINAYNQQNGISDTNNSMVSYQKALNFTSNTSFQTHRPKIVNLEPIQDSYNQNATRSIYDGIINAYAEGLDGGVVNQPSEKNNGSYYFNSNHPGENDAYNKGFAIYNSTNEAKGAADYLGGNPTQGQDSPHNMLVGDTDYQKGAKEAEAGYLFKAIGVSTDGIDTTSPEYRRGEIKFSAEDRKNFTDDYPSGYTGVYPVGYRIAMQMQSTPSYSNPNYSSKQSYKAITDAYLNTFGFADNSSYPYSWDANLIYRTFYNIAASTFRKASLNALKDYQNGNNDNQPNSAKSSNDSQTSFYYNQPLTEAVYKQEVQKIKDQVSQQQDLLKPGSSESNDYQRAINNYYNTGNHTGDGKNTYYDQVIKGLSDGSNGVTTADESGSSIYNIARSQSLGIRNGLLDLSKNNGNADVPDNINGLAYQDAYHAIQDGYKDRKDNNNKNKDLNAYNTNAIYHYAYDLAGNDEYLKSLGLPVPQNDNTNHGKGQPSGGSDNGSKNQPSGGNDNGSKNQPSGGNDNGSKNQPSGGNDSGSKDKPSGGNDSGSKDKPSGGSDSGSKNQPSGGNDSGSKDKPSGGSDNESKNQPSGGNDNGSKDQPSGGSDSGSKNQPSGGSDSGSKNQPNGGSDNGSKDKPSGGSDSGSKNQLSGGSDNGFNDNPSTDNETKPNSEKNKPTKNHSNNNISDDGHAEKNKLKLNYQKSLGKRAGYNDARNNHYIDIKKLKHKYSSYYIHAYTTSFRNELRRLKPTYVYNINGLYIHSSTKFDSLSRIKGYAKKPRNRSHVFRVHSIAYSKHGIPRYKLIDGGYITVNKRYVLDAYYRHHDAPISKIKIIKPIGTYIYNSKQFNERTAVKKMPYGSIVKVKAIKKLGPITRFYIGNGKYISSNKTIVYRIS